MNRGKRFAGQGQPNRAEQTGDNASLGVAEQRIRHFVTPETERGVRIHDEVEGSGYEQILTWLKAGNPLKCSVSTPIVFSTIIVVLLF